MNPNTTLLRRDTELGSSPSGTAPLPIDLLEQVRGRVRILALLLLFAFGLDPLLSVIIYVGTRMSGDPLPAGFSTSISLQWLNVIAVLVSLGISLIARRRDVDPVRLHRVGLVYMVFICLVISFTDNWQIYLAKGNASRSRKKLS